MQRKAITEIARSLRRESSAAVVVASAASAASALSSLGSRPASRPSPTTLTTLATLATLITRASDTAMRRGSRMGRVVPTDRQGEGKDNDRDTEAIAQAQAQAQDTTDQSQPQSQRWNPQFRSDGDAYYHGSFRGRGYGSRGGGGSGSGSARRGRGDHFNSFSAATQTADGQGQSLTEPTIPTPAWLFQQPNLPQQQYPNHPPFYPPPSHRVAEMRMGMGGGGMDNGPHLGRKRLFGSRIESSAPQAEGQQGLPLTPTTGTPSTDEPGQSSRMPDSVPQQFRSYSYEPRGYYRRFPSFFRQQSGHSVTGYGWSHLSWQPRLIRQHSGGPLTGANSQETSHTSNSVQTSEELQPQVPMEAESSVVAVQGTETASAETAEAKEAEGHTSGTTRYPPVLTLLYPKVDYPVDIRALLPSAGVPTLYLMRGVSGSGKSTAINFILYHVAKADISVVCSADHYYLQPDGTYIFDPTVLGEAHAACQQKARYAMSLGIRTVIIDNTNTTRQEAKPYAQLCVRFGYRMVVVEPGTPWRFDVDVLTQRNQHNVPREAIQKMVDRWQTFDTIEQLLGERDYAPSRLPPRGGLRGGPRGGGRGGGPRGGGGSRGGYYEYESKQERQRFMTQRSFDQPNQLELGEDVTSYTVPQQEHPKPSEQEGEPQGDEASNSVPKSSL